MKKIVCIKLFIFTVFQSYYLSAQINNKTNIMQFAICKGDTICYFPILEIKDTTLYPVLDTVLAYNQLCTYTQQGIKANMVLSFISQREESLNKPVLRIVSDQRTTGITTRINDLGYLFIGCFYYKDYLFIVSDPLKMLMGKNMFLSTNKVEKIDIDPKEGSRIVYIQDDLVQESFLIDYIITDYGFKFSKVFPCSLND